MHERDVARVRRTTITFVIWALFYRFSFRRAPEGHISEDSAHDHMEGGLDMGNDALGRETESDEKLKTSKYAIVITSPLRSRHGIIPFGSPGVTAQALFLSPS